MNTATTSSTMSPEEFTAAITALGWKQSDFCRKAGVTKQTPSRWATGHTPVPAWVPAYLGLLLDLKRLHAAHVVPQSAHTAGWYMQDLERLHAAYLAPPKGDD